MVLWELRARQHAQSLTEVCAGWKPHSDGKTPESDYVRPRNSPTSELPTSVQYKNVANGFYVWIGCGDV